MHTFNIDIHGINESFIHLTEDIKQFNNFYDQVISSGHKQLFYTVFDGKECVTREELFEEFSSKLLFPDYFSNNWDSFDEIMNDLEWLDSNQFVLFFKNLDLLLSQDSKNRDMFFEIISENMKEWVAGNDYELEREPMPFCLIIHSNRDIVKELNMKFENAEIKIF